MGSFSNKTFLFESHPRDLNERAFTVVREETYTTNSGKTITIPVGYQTDFASVPRFFHRIVNPADSHRNAAVVHDILCDESPHSCSHKEAAQIFDEAMKDLGVPALRRKLMVSAVLLGGPKFKKDDL